MRAKDYLKDNSISMIHFNEVSRLIKELSPIRHDKEATVIYFSQILTTDIRETKYKEWEQLHKQHGAIGIEPDYISNSNEVYINDAEGIRHELLRAVKDDPSFGYIASMLDPEKQEPTQLQIEQAIREDLTIALKSAEERIVYLGSQPQSIPPTNADEPLQSEHRTMKVTTDALVKMLNILGVKKGDNADATKISELISYITGYSRNTIRQRLSNTEELTSSHRKEVEKINHLFEELNINITIKYNKTR